MKTKKKTRSCETVHQHTAAVNRARDFARVLRLSNPPGGRRRKVLRRARVIVCSPIGYLYSTGETGAIAKTANYCCCCYCCCCCCGCRGGCRRAFAVAVLYSDRGTHRDVRLERVKRPTIVYGGCLCVCVCERSRAVHRRVV